MDKVYIDYNATTPVDERVIEEMLPYFSGEYGNPSSIHSFGSRARAALDISRERVAALIGSRPKDIVFTSGGSEGNSYAISGAALSLRDKGNHIISTRVEHTSVLETLRFLESQGFEVTCLPVDSSGLIDLGQLEASITDGTILISCIWANNETGVISPVEKIGEIAREKGIVFHTDAVQALGKLSLDINKMPVDMATFSSHKIYGPKGVGAVYIRQGIDAVPLVHGGGQEKGRRSGTENVSGIAGFGKASQIIADEMGEETEKIKQITLGLLDRVMNEIDDVTINGLGAERISNTLNFSFGGVEGESLVMNLDLEGIAASTGSACSEGNVEPSHVLLAMGLTGEEAVSSLRLSLGRFSTPGDVDRVMSVLPGIVERIRTTAL